MVRIGVLRSAATGAGRNPALPSGKLRAGALRAVLAAGEAGAVVGGGDAELSLDDAAKILFADEAHHRGNALQRQVGLLQSTAGGFEPDQLDRLGGGPTGLGDIGSRESARAHARGLGEALDAKVFGE